MINALESTYTDICTIKRSGEYEDPETFETKFGESTVYENVKCALSQVSRSNYNANQSNSKNEIKYNVKLFISPNIEILTGDKAIVLRQGKTFEFKTGEPFPYISHQEVPLLKEGDA